jgi:hypothetical protein
MVASRILSSRPTFSGISGRSVAIGCSSGRVLIMTLSEIPVLFQRYEVLTSNVPILFIFFGGILKFVTKRLRWLDFNA